MQNKSSVAFISSTDIPSSRALATCGTLLVTLSGKSAVYSTVEPETHTPFFRRLQVLHPLDFPGTPTMLCGLKTSEKLAPVTSWEQRG